MTLWGLRSIASMQAFVGLGAITAGIALLVAGDAGRNAAGPVFGFGALLITGGLLGLYFGTSRLTWFRAERVAPRTHAGAPQRSFAIIALPLLALALALVFELRPLGTLWRELIVALRGLGPWDVRHDMSMSGLVLAPLFGILAFPAFETLNMLALIAASCLLPVLAAMRSRVLVRAAVVCAALLGSCSMAALLGGTAMHRVTTSIEQVVRTSAHDAVETPRALEIIDRYRRVTGRASHALAWGGIAFACCVPVLVRATRSPTPAAAETPVTDGAAALGDPPMPGDPDRRRFYEEAAAVVDEGHRGVTGSPGLVVLLAGAALLGLAALAALLSVSAHLLSR